MNCAQCTTAEKRRGAWPEYRAGCFGCTSRAIARCGAADEAFTLKQWANMDDLLARLYPKDTHKQALTEIRRWWAMDHEHEVAHSAGGNQP